MTLPPQLLEQLVAALADEVAERLGPELAASLAGMTTAAAAERWRLWPVDEVASRLGRSTRWVRERVRRGDLPHVRLDGGALAFDPDDVRAFAGGRRLPAEGPETLAACLQPSREPRAAALLGPSRLPTKQRVER
jgi:hypothetical protein